MKTRNEIGGFWRRLARISVFALAAFLAGLPGYADETRRLYLDAFGAVLTKNTFEQAVDPFAVEFADSYLIGVGIGWERRIARSRFHFGAQFQAVAHAGRQDHFEFNLPLVLRYVPPDPWPRWLESASFGLGLSHATKVPQVEIDRTGESQRTFAYWLAELEIDTGHPENTMFVRLHHRSDAFGAFEAESGSTALSVGWRMPF
ncbi:hypothetical protein AB2B41_14295 [Marimonas sp. MJW-29]|uniref:Outer membrane protein beta-barrel domain-containing protein n=1 Tax=Sulfitobacter sediminis TaxID=3234186 RepID=A0ABV3RP76_9RHOB